MDHAQDSRPVRPALWNGLRCRCPRCGTGALLYRYLKVHDSCSHCGLDLTHHRADDGPPYLTILIVAHVIIPILHVVYVYTTPEPWVVATLLTTLAVALCLVLLPRMKGLIIGFQWAKRMGGFGHSP